MPDQNPALPLNARYATQVADDLERITTRIGAVQEELAALQADRALLERVRASIEDVPAPRKAPDGALPAPQPTPATTVPEEAEQKKPEAAAPPAPARKTRASRPAARRASGPALVDLVLKHLSAQGEPRSAAEVHAALEKAHPERRLSVPLVRNAIEARVAQGEIARTKQGRSVFYSAVRTTGAGAGSAPESVSASASGGGPK